jgi:hypothetical protein
MAPARSAESGRTWTRITLSFTVPKGMSVGWMILAISSMFVEDVTVTLVTPHAIKRKCGRQEWLVELTWPVGGTACRGSLQ